LIIKYEYNITPRRLLARVAAGWLLHIAGSRCRQRATAVKAAGSTVAAVDKMLEVGWRAVADYCYVAG